MYRILSLILPMLFLSTLAISQTRSTGADVEKIIVLNVGVFHFGFTPDANKTEYDETDKNNLKEISEITRALAEFQPTIILVEVEPKNQIILEQEYKRYRQNPSLKTKFSGTETQLLGFEVGRLANTGKIFGIDHQLDYMYNADDFAKSLDAKNYFLVKARLENFSKNRKDVNEIGLKEKLLSMNTEDYYDYNINRNADLLTYANSKEGFEGVDEAAKFYQRNLRMYANINKLELDTSERVLIISGAAHASFFHNFMGRSPIYEIVELKNILD